RRRWLRGFAGLPGRQAPACRARVVAEMGRVGSSAQPDATPCCFSLSWTFSPSSSDRLKQTIAHGFAATDATFQETLMRTFGLLKLCCQSATMIQHRGFEQTRRGKYCSVSATAFFELSGAGP